MPADFLKKTGEILRAVRPLEERLRDFTAAVGSFLSGGVVSILLFDRDTDDFYLRHAVARLAAHRNVWWSMANEYDLMPTKTGADWERFARVVQESDPYQHLRSIHNCRGFYDHARPWVTHLSIQRSDVGSLPVRANFSKETHGGPLKPEHEPETIARPSQHCCYSSNPGLPCRYLRPHPVWHRQKPKSDRLRDNR